jgi:tetratricopeptide (TPR) repeat protein
MTTLGVTPAPSASSQPLNDAYFTGRDAELRGVCGVIEAVLVNDCPASSPSHLAVLGEAGVGKSSLISQAIFKMQEAHRSSAGEVFFMRLRGRGAAAAEQDLVLHARTLGCAATSAPSDVLPKLRDYLSRARFVAVIDDADDAGLHAAARWIPSSSARHAVLLTSRLHRASPALRHVQAALGTFDTLLLTGLDEAAGMELLCKLCARCSFAPPHLLQLKTVARRSQLLPLALRVFGSWCNSRHHRDTDALHSARKSFSEEARRACLASHTVFDQAAVDRRFRSDHLARTGFSEEAGVVARMLHDWTQQADDADREQAVLDGQFPPALLATVRLVLHELDRINVVDAGACRLLLSILSLSHSLNTPFSLFVGFGDSCIPRLESISLRDGLRRIVPLLQGSGLVRVDNEAFSMHPLLQRAVWHAVAGGTHAAVWLIEARLEEASAHTADACREVLPAAYHVVRQVQGLDPDRAQWCNTARERILELMSLIGGGELEVEIRRDILEDVGEDNSAAEYATPAIALARALCAAGRQHEALGFFEKVAAHCRRVLPAEHCDIATAMSNAAACYFELGRYAEALDLEQQVLAFRMRVLPPDHPDIATTMITAANIYSKLERHAEALSLEENALAIRRRVLPADHPDIASAMLNTATSYFTLGRHAEALCLFEHALEMCRRVLPADHPDIATAMLNTAISYSKADRHAEALDLHMQVLALRLRVLPADHPDIAAAMLNTASSYYQLGRHAEALDLEEEALALHLRVLPADHPDIATAMLNTAISYSKADRHAEALDLHMQVLALRLRVLPADHPDIAAAMLNTASSYYQLGRHAEALDLNEQALAVRRRVLPPDHVDTATAMLHTAISYSKVGRHEEALGLEEQVLAMRQRVLPADHPDIASAKFNIASSYYQLGRHAEALDFKEQVLALRLRVLPADHPDIAMAMLSAAISYSKADRHAEALDLHMQVLALRLRVLPADHPDIAAAMTNAASSCTKLGRHAEALDLKQQALALRQKRM